MCWKAGLSHDVLSSLATVRPERSRYRAPYVGSVSTKSTPASGIASIIWTQSPCITRPTKSDIGRSLVSVLAAGQTVVDGARLGPPTWGGHTAIELFIQFSPYFQMGLLLPV